MTRKPCGHLWCPRCPDDGLCCRYARGRCSARHFGAPKKHKRKVFGRRCEIAWKKKGRAR